MFNDLGRIIATRSIAEEIKNKDFCDFINKSMNRYVSEDWGELCAEDINANNTCMKNAGRILASYDIPEEARSDSIYDNNIYIITEWDRSATTILFSSEY